MHINVSPLPDIRLVPSAPDRRSADSRMPPDDRTDRSKRFEFERMTIGEFSDAINTLYSSGRISTEEFREIGRSCLDPIPPMGTSHEDYLAMPMSIAYDRFQEIISSADMEGRLEERDRYQRVSKLLQRFEGTPQTLDVSA
jgi:hypothetical protein